MLGYIVKDIQNNQYYGIVPEISKNKVLLYKYIDINIITAIIEKNPEDTEEEFLNSLGWRVKQIREMISSRNTLKR